MVEDQFKNPFDVSHIVLHRYKHLGEDIGAAEAKRFKKDLAEIVRQVIAAGKVDSPFYGFLTPPAQRGQTAMRGLGAQAESGVANEPPAPPDENWKTLLEKARAAKAAGRWIAAKELLEIVHETRPNDESVIQQLVLATYKSKDPDVDTALDNARKLMVATLNPGTTNDPETVGLWGAIHKRRWEQHQQQVSTSTRRLRATNAAST